MSNHITEWLSAYLDGELKGRKRHQVKEHLAECGTCRAEFESLQGLSILLQQVPAVEFTSNERFVSQVNLRLPQRQVKSTTTRVIEVGWWMIPIGLLTAWIFLNTAIFINEIVSTADNFGLLDSASALLVADPSDNAVWTAGLGQAGLLEGDSLQWAESTESLTRNVLPQSIGQVSIAILYLAWIAIWWARQTRRELVPLPGG